MIALLLTLLFAQELPCRGEAASMMEAARARADSFDIAGAIEIYAAAAQGCNDADVTAHYLRGLLAAREAYRQGGSPESLEPVKQAIAALESRGARFPGSAEVARFVLLAASAASQSERDEMALLLDHAARLETLQLAAGQPGAPAVTAHEVAGDLWLQVHRYEEARAAYRRAAEQVGKTPRIALGLARIADRLQEKAVACAEFSAVLKWWGTRPGEPAEIAEARDFIRQPSCETSGPLAGAADPTSPAAR